MNKKIVASSAKGLNPYNITGSSNEIAKRMEILETDISDDSIFKVYDNRWDINELSPEVGYWIGRMFGQKLEPGSKLTLSFDAREASEIVNKSVIDGLIDAGINVLLVGKHGTGFLKFASLYNYLIGVSDAGIQVTGSHCEPETVTGLKLVFRGRPFCRQDIIDLRDDIRAKKFTIPKKGNYQDYDMTDKYKDYIVTMARKYSGNNKPFSKLNIFFANGGGCDPEMIRDILVKLGANVNLHHGHQLVKNHKFADPNEPESEYMKKEMIVAANSWEGELRAIENDLPVLRIYGDPDKDRAGIFASLNAIFAAEHLKLNVLAFKELGLTTSNKIVVDIRASVALRALIREMGFEDVEAAAGYAYVMDKIEEVGANFGSEMTLHTFTNMVGQYLQVKGLQIRADEVGNLASLTIDDMLSSLLSILLLAARHGKGFQKMIDQIYIDHPNLVRTTSIEKRVTLKVPEAIKFAIAKEVNRHVAEADVYSRLLLTGGLLLESLSIETDGTKIIFKDEGDRLVGSWGSRVSNTGAQNCLNPETLEGDDDRAKYLHHIFMLENLRAANVLNQDVSKILKDNLAQGSKITIDVDYLIQLAESFSDIYVGLPSIIEESTRP